MKKVLSIAGSDCSGGAGIQADIKTISAFGHYAMSVITALTAQNTTGVYGILEVDPAFVGLQMDCVFQDIMPDAVKIGMVSNAGILSVIADKLQEYGVRNIVVDPVMIATSGSRLMAGDATEALVRKLFPLAAVITPNLSEAEVLSGMEIRGPADMEQAGRMLAGLLEGAVLLKGGHLTGSADDLLVKGERDERGAGMGTQTLRWFHGERINNPNTHGTGCTLSSAIACGLAEGLSLEESVLCAKKYVSGALRAMLDIGKGRGPLNHQYAHGREIS